MQITPSIVGIALAILVLINLAAVYRAHARHRRVRAVLELPRRMARRDKQVQIERVVEVFAETDARLRKRAPHLSKTERHEMARALMRAKGLLPPDTPVLTRVATSLSSPADAR